MSNEPGEIKNDELSEFINLRRVVASKDQKMAKLLPAFIYNYLNRIIHVKEINAIVARNRHLIGIDFVRAVLHDFGFESEIIGGENLSGNKKKTVVSNHPLGGPDGLIMMDIAGQFYPDVKFLANDLLLNLENIKPLFIPVNKHGTNSKEMIKLIDEVYGSDAVILNFPFGLCSRKKRGKIMDLEWKKSFITKSRQYQRDIIPAFTSGRNSDFFYNLANFRKFLRIKVNFEMLYLPDEMFKQKNKKITVTFGKPISSEIFDKRFTDAEWAEKLRLHVYRIAENPDVSFDVNFH